MATPRPTALNDLKDSALKGYEIAEASLCDMVNMQGKTGSWDVSEYMVGLYNGLEMALAIVQGREPEYRSTLDVQKITPAYMVIGQPETAATEENEGEADATK